MQGHIHPCIRACRHPDIPNTNTLACLARIPTFITVHNAIVYTIHKRAPLLRTHASRLCTALTRVFGVSSCGQVLQQCAALLLRLWSCSEGCTHVRVREQRYSARAELTMRDPIHTFESEVIYIHAYVHADIPNTNTRACLVRIPTFITVHNAIVYTMHKRAPLLRTHASKAMYCTHLSVWSVELWASAAAMCCAPSAPTELDPRLYAYVCV
jgi:hypothetical protein